MKKRINQRKFDLKFNDEKKQNHLEDFSNDL